MTLTINGTKYKVSSLDADPEVAKKAWRLTTDDGKCYDVWIDVVDMQPRCECWDFLVRRANKDRAGCKHISTLRDEGLL